VTTPQHHDDPLGDGLGKILQALAVLTTVGESAARFAAAGAQSRAAKAERQANAERAADGARQQADQTAQRAQAAQQRVDRRLMDLAFDDAWLSTAEIDATANLWRTAALYANSGDKRAAEAMRRAQDRLATLNPGLVDAYARHRAAGMNIADAMRAAAHDVWQHQTRPTTAPARPHGSTGEPPAAFTSGPRAIGATPDPHGQSLVDDLEAATRAEVTRLAAGIDPDVLDRLQRQWRTAGHAPAADAVAVLANAARQLRAEGVLAGQVAGIATVRRGVNHANDTDHPATVVSADAADVPVRSSLAGNELAAQGFDRAAQAVRAAQAAEAHLTGLADQQQRSGTVEQGVTDLPGTLPDEHRDGQAAGRVHRGGAEHDQAAADQQQRLSRAFPPLDRVSPVFSYTSSPFTSQPVTTRRRGSTR
jgi:hypothetical protein